jgi:short-subunit dehydrogenase
MKPSLRPLEDQVVVITGASSGIGLVTARMAAARGARLVLTARNAAALDALAAEIGAAGGTAIAVPADVGVPADVERVARTAARELGGFDTWVNNAGVSIFGRIEEVSLEDMRRMFDTVYWGVVHGSLEAVGQFRERGGGALVNVGSLFGDRATPLQSTYASAKHAVHGFTEALRMELEADGAPVSVTLVHSGRIDTPYNEHAHAFTDRHPAHRVMVYEPDAVAEATRPSTRCATFTSVARRRRWPCSGAWRPGSRTWRWSATCSGASSIGTARRRRGSTAGSSRPAVTRASGARTAASSARAAST